MSSIDEPVLGRRRGRSWVRVAHGVHKPQQQHSDLPAWQLVLPPSGRFTHLTAAGLYGWWLPPLPDLPVLAAIRHDESRPQRHGIVVSRHRALPAALERDGLLVDPPADVLLACARDLSLIDLVLLVDCALHSGACTRRDLAAVAEARRRGAPLLRRALRYADGRAESIWEGMLRLLHVSCGIDVVPQYELRSEGGLLVARADLWLVGTTAFHEYDGGDHLTRFQQRRDLDRARRINGQAWTRRGYTSAEVLHQGVTILRDADLSLGREHRPDRIRTWHRWLATSTFTPSGQARLRRRLGLPPGLTDGPATGDSGRRNTA